MNGDGTINITDYLRLYNKVKRNYGTIARDQNCPAVNRGDVNCDGKLDKLDLAYLNAYLMNHGPEPCNPCDCNPYPGGCIPQ